jgi:CRISPR-associated Csx10 family RAMP protein
VAGACRIDPGRVSVDGWLRVVFSWYPAGKKGPRNLLLGGKECRLRSKWERLRELAVQRELEGMPRYMVEAEPESPVVLRRERQSQRSEGIEYVPGTQVRGAFARIYLWQRGEADATFQRIFAEGGQCRFGPLDPGNAYFPKTAYSCKRVPGFKVNSQRGDGGHGVVDLLPVIARWSLTGQSPRPVRCRQCDHDLKPMTGFYFRAPDGTWSDLRHRWRRLAMAHVGIERIFGTAAESIFFHLPALEPNPESTDDSPAPVLYGWIDTEREIIELLQELLRAEGNVLRIGHARTRGYGRLKVRIHDQPLENASDWEEWNRSFLEYLGPGLDPENDFLFTLDFPTGAILVDDLLRYTVDPSQMVPWLPRLGTQSPGRSPRQISRVDFASGEIQFVAAVTQHERVRGWNFAHGLPRTDEWMVCRGAVYAYLYRGNSQGKQELVDRLWNLQNHGVGIRRPEGFGAVVINDPFHVQFGASGRNGEEVEP